jgi:hypothetical protein
MVRLTSPGVLLLMAIFAIAGPEPARGNLPWPTPKKETIHLRLVALAWNHPRSSFATNEEVFIAEKELNKGESRLVKLVYNFLSYQPRLSDEGLDYSTVHELLAVRDPHCDETLAQIATGQTGDWRQVRPQLKYSTAAPSIDLWRLRHPVPCYTTNADDYTKPIHYESEPEAPLPTLTPPQNN